MAVVPNVALAPVEVGVLVLDFIFGIVLLRKTIKIGTTALRNYYLCVTGFFFAHGVFLITHVIYLFNNIGTLFDIGVLFVLTGVVLLVASIEFTVFKRSKYFFTIFGCISLVIIGIDTFTRVILFNVRLMVLIQDFANPLLVVFILLNYINAVKKATRPTRRNSLILLCAIFLLTFAELARSQFANQLIPGVDIIGAIIMAIAIVLLFYGILKLSVWKRETHEDQKTS